MLTRELGRLILLPCPSRGASRSRMGPSPRSELNAHKPHSVNLRVIPLCLHSWTHFGFPAPLGRGNTVRFTKQNKINSKPPGLQKGSLSPLLRPCLIISVAQLALITVPPCGADLVQPMRTTRSSARVSIKQYEYCIVLLSAPFQHSQRRNEVLASPAEANILPYV